MRWLKWKEKKGDRVDIIHWDHIYNMDKCGEFRRNRKPTNRYSTCTSSMDQARR